MLRYSLVALVVAACGLGWLPAGSAAPKAKDNAPTEKELKEFATKVVAALLKKDIDGFLDMCEVPFLQPGGYFSKDKDDLRRWITKALNNGPLNRDANEVKGIETFEAAKARFSASEIMAISQVLADKDFVVDVATEFGGEKVQLSLLLKVKAGKPRVAGWEVIR